MHDRPTPNRMRPPVGLTVMLITLIALVGVVGWVVNTDWEPAPKPKRRVRGTGDDATTTPAVAPPPRFPHRHHHNPANAESPAPTSDNRAAPVADRGTEPLGFMGRVTAADTGQPLADALVEVWVLGGRVVSQPTTNTGEYHVCLDGFSEAPERICVAVKHNQFIGESREFKQLRRQLHRVDFELQPGVPLTGTVRYADGRAADNAVIRLSAIAENGDVKLNREDRTAVGPDGRYAIGVKPGRLFVVVEAAENGEPPNFVALETLIDVPIDANPHTHDFIVQATAHLEFTVEIAGEVLADFDGQIVVEFPVLPATTCAWLQARYVSGPILSLATDEPTTHTQRVILAAANFVLPLGEVSRDHANHIYGLPPGRYRLVPYDCAPFYGAEVVVELAAGEHRVVNLRLTMGRKLRVTVVDAEGKNWPEAPLWLEGLPSHEAGIRSTDSSGVYEFTGLEPRLYTVRIHGVGQASAVVDLTLNDGDVTLVINPGCVLEVAVVWPENATPAKPEVLLDVQDLTNGVILEIGATTREAVRRYSMLAVATTVKVSATVFDPRYDASIPLEPVTVTVTQPFTRLEIPVRITHTLTVIVPNLLVPRLLAFDGDTVAEVSKVEEFNTGWHWIFFNPPAGSHLLVLTHTQQGVKHFQLVRVREHESQTVTVELQLHTVAVRVIDCEGQPVAVRAALRLPMMTPKKIFSRDPMQIEPLYNRFEFDDREPLSVQEQEAPDGMIRFENVLRGHYRLLLFLPRTEQLLADRGLDVDRDHTDLTIQLGVSVVTAAVRGRIVDATGRGLSGLRIQVEGVFAGATSSVDGRFDLGRVPVGRYRVWLLQSQQLGGIAEPAMELNVVPNLPPVEWRVERLISGCRIAQVSNETQHVHGLFANDVITAVNGKPVESLIDLIRVIGRLPLARNSVLTLTVRRNGQDVMASAAYDGLLLRGVSFR